MHGVTIALVNAKRILLAHGGPFGIMGGWGKGECLQAACLGNCLRLDLRQVKLRCFLSVSIYRQISLHRFK